MTRVSKFGINLDSLENKLVESKGLGLKLEQLQAQIRQGIEANQAA